jgi:hypothetical protein
MRGDFIEYGYDTYHGLFGLIIMFIQIMRRKWDKTWVIPSIWPVVISLIEGHPCWQGSCPMPVHVRDGKAENLSLYIYVYTTSS